MSTTVTTKSGTSLRGKLVDADQGTVTVKVTVRDKVPVPLKDGGTKWVPMTEARLLTFDYANVQAVKTENRTAFGFALAGTVVAGVGLIGLGPSLVAAGECQGFGCIGPDVAVATMAGMAVLGTLVGVPAWAVWGDSRRTYEAPKVTFGPTGLGGTF